MKLSCKILKSTKNKLLKTQINLNHYMYFSKQIQFSISNSSKHVYSVESKFVIMDNLNSIHFTEYI